MDDIKSKNFVYLLTLNCVLGSFLFGYQMVNVGCLQTLIARYNSINAEHEGFYMGLITSALPFGALVGCFFTNKLIRSVGARKSLILLDLCCFMFISLQTFELTIFILTYTRFFIGMIVGLNSAIIPVYILSLSPPAMSGTMGSLNQLFITIGIAFGYLMGFWIRSDSAAMPSVSWRLVLFLPSSVACLLRTLNLIFFLPFDLLQTHYDLGQMAMIDNYCEIVYKRLDGRALCKKLNLDVQNHRRFHGQPNTKGYRNRKMLAVVVAISGQFSGINAILLYAKYIFLEITGNQNDSDVCSFLLGLVQCLATLISGLFLDKLGKRTFMLIGEAIISLSLFLMFVDKQLAENQKVIFIILVFLHVIGFSISLGPIIWVYISEIVREQWQLVTLIWFVTFGVAISTQILFYMIRFKLFLIYGCLSFLCLVYLYKFMKETKGLSQNQIEELFQQKHSIPIENTENQNLRP